MKDERNTKTQLAEELVELRRRVAELEDLEITNKVTQRELRENLEKFRRAMKGAIYAMAMAVELRDPYTAGHHRNVAHLSLAIAKKLRLSEDESEGIALTAIIHDLGRTSIPLEILSKPSHLTEVELLLVKSHPRVGHDILKMVDFPWPIAQIVLQHHERLDGSGYPKGARGDEIVVGARILAVADVVEAMSSHRPHRPAHGIEKALEEILKNRGILYDSDVVDACRRVFREGEFAFNKSGSTSAYTIAWKGE